jgi:hypothetical protein
MEPRTTSRASSLRQMSARRYRRAFLPMRPQEPAEVASYAASTHCDPDASASGRPLRAVQRFMGRHRSGRPVAASRSSWRRRRLHPRCHVGSLLLGPLTIHACASAVCNHSCLAPSDRWRDGQQRKESQGGAPVQHAAVSGPSQHRVSGAAAVHGATPILMRSNSVEPPIRSQFERELALASRVMAADESCAVWRRGYAPTAIRVSLAMSMQNSSHVSPRVDPSTSHVSEPSGFSSNTAGISEELALSRLDAAAASTSLPIAVADSPIAVGLHVSPPNEQLCFFARR